MIRQTFNVIMSLTQYRRTCDTIWARWQLTMASGLLVVGMTFATTATAQITPARSMTGRGTAVATLDEQLINRLRATTNVQADYLRYVVKLVDEQKLEKRLVIAVERYALRRNPRYPFPYFERALHYESAKRGVVLPPVRLYQSTAIVR